MLYQGIIKKNKKWIDMKKQIDQDLITVEPFVEAVPQVFVISTIWGVTEFGLGPLLSPHSI